MRADARSLPLPRASVDLVVTSPPYFGLRSYHDGGEHYDGQIGEELTIAEFVDSLIQVTAECARVLKPTGSIWVNLGDKYSRGSRPAGQPQQSVHKGRPRNLVARKGRDNWDRIPGKSLLGVPWRYAIRCIDDLGLILRAEVVWSKPNGLPESVNDRVRRSHETWFHFTRKPYYFASTEAVRSLPSSSVWDVATEPLQVPADIGVAHFAAFPTELPRRIIQGWCPEGGTVLDPFGGTGTTALVAHALGRKGVSVDLSADYCRLAQWRLNDPKQMARAAQRSFTASDLPIDGQGDLLSLLGDDAA